MQGPVFSARTSIAKAVERCIRNCSSSLEAALYRFNNPRIAGAIREVQGRGASVRLLLDHGKYSSDRETRRLLELNEITFRLLRGRKPSESKMHHKFAVVDRKVLITGSYNWTLESEETNYENVILLEEPRIVVRYSEEFELLWALAGEEGGQPS